MQIINKIISKFIVRHNAKAKSLIALSFDDGPMPIDTEIVLDALKKHSMKATFFVLGQLVEKNPELCQRMFSEGHEVASHGYSHTSNAKLSYNGIKLEIEKTDAIIEKVIGVKPKLYRPPYGIISLPLIYFLQVKRRQPIILWSKIIEHEWDYTDKDKLLLEFSNLNITDGDIVLLHDAYSLTSTALSSMLLELENRQLRSTTISTLIAQK